VTRPDDAPDAALAQSVFEELGRLSFAEHSLESFLQRVTDAAAGVLPGRPSASVTVLRRGAPSTVAASDPLAAVLDEAQYRAGGGPCVEAATTGGPAEVPDTAAEQRWPAFAALAAEHGFGSVLSHPLPPHEELSAALNIYSPRPHATNEHSRALVARFAAYAAVPVSNLYLYRSAVERAEHLQVALDSRSVIDQAKGILMERFTLTADQAFQALAQVSMENNVRVREVAQRFVANGDLPGR
jgi:GAF domain-containing protein